MKLIVQPADGTAPVIKAIRQAKKTIEIVIFRFDQAEIEKALIDAVERGIFVHALIAFTNRGGEEGLRQLEMRFLEKGITVARTAGDLVRYHGKMLLIDRKELFVLAYNFTHLDTERSRSFGIFTKNAEIVQEAAKLFDSDTKRQPYKAESSKLIVSPANARQRLAAFIKGARRELLIYDIKISDRAMLRVLGERLRAGVNMQIIGEVSKNAEVPFRCLQRLRLHTRVIIRDRKAAFLGSQSLRKVELDARREIGIIFNAPKVINSLIAIFEDDWKASEPVDLASRKREAQATRKVVKSATKRLPVAPVVKHVVKAIRKQPDLQVPRRELEETVEVAVKTALEKAVRKAAGKVVHNNGQ